jgi:hypothetical protein
LRKFKLLPLSLPSYYNKQSTLYNFIIDFLLRSVFCVEHLISWPGLMAHIYPTLGMGERLFLLEVCREVASKGTIHLPPDAAMLISNEFKKKADTIFVAHNGLPTPDPSESAALLEAVAAASGIVDSAGAAKLQEDGALLTSAVCMAHEQFLVFINLWLPYFL